MPSESDDSPGTHCAASPRYAGGGNAGENDPLRALIAESEAAVDALLASTDWAAQDALIADLERQSRRAADALLGVDARVTHCTPARGLPVRSPRSRPTMRLIRAGIHTGDIVRLLRDQEGLPVQPWTLRYAARRERIPAPFTTSSGDHAWSPDDLPAIRRYFQNPVGPGRPRKNA